MITCNLMGGLGNQLFQIFATISYCMYVKQKFVFLDLDKIEYDIPDVTVRYTYWNSILDSLKPFLVKNFNYDIIEQEKNFSYNKLNIYNIKNNILLHGYFQSYKYFNHNYEIILRLLKINNKKLELFNKLDLKDKYFNNYISIHFRLGDYKKKTDYHPIMSYKYYKNSLKFILSKIKKETTNVLYFCEDEDIETVSKTIDILKEEFKSINFINGTKNLSDWEQMLLMSLCHHNIIANSSFSWWGAYFNSWTDKIVCYPSIWFGSSANHNTKDLCPPEWNKIYS